MAVSTMTTSKRRLLYGLNVAITTVLAFALVAIVVWAAGRFGGRTDWTSSGVNSLNPRSVQLLERLSQPITITGIYSTVLKDLRPIDEKHRARVGDLLDLYQTAGKGKVATYMLDPMKDQPKVNELLARLKEKPAYKDEAKPHAQALESFPELSARIAEFIHGEAGELERLLGNDPALEKIQPVAIIIRNLQYLVREAQTAEAEVRALQEGEIPRYGRAVETAREFIRQVQTTLQDSVDWMTRSGAPLVNIAAETRAFFSTAEERYGLVQAEVRKQYEAVKELGAVKLETLYETLKRDKTVLVETENEAVVLTHQEVWPYRMDRNLPPPPDGDPSDFAGEQAISSAILKLTQKSRTAVIFTRYGGSPLLTAPPPANPMMMRQPEQAPYQQIRDLLEKENFIAREWDVAAEPNPPAIEEASRFVYVVFPPTPPQQSMNPLQPPPSPRISGEQKQRIYDAIKESAMAIFLTPWLPPASQFMPTPEKCEFNTYLQENWGIAVEDGHLAWQFTLNPQRENLMFPANRSLIVDSTVFQFTDQPIGKPLRGLPCGFQSSAPLRILDEGERPQSVRVEPIAVTNRNADAWAIGDIMRFSMDMQNNQGTRRYDDDIASPFPLAAAATDAEGRNLVVFASDSFISDGVLDMAQVVMASGALRLAKLYPGNADLFINAIHWVTGNADRIAVGTQQSDVPRLDKLKEGRPVLLTRVFLVGIWPLLALLVGAGVWLIRRR